MDGRVDTGIDAPIRRVAEDRAPDAGLTPIAGATTMLPIVDTHMATDAKKQVTNRATMSVCTAMHHRDAGK